MLQILNCAKEFRHLGYWNAKKKGAFGVKSIDFVWGILFLLLWIHHSSRQHDLFPVGS